MTNRIKTFGAPLVLALSFTLLSACASPGPKLSSVRAHIPAVRSGESRIYVYRTSIMGAAVQPDIKLNGKVIGTAVPNVVTFVDVAPGPYKVECTTEKTNDVSFTLVAGETKYIKLVPYFGLFLAHIDPQVATENDGESDIRDLALVVSPTMKSRMPASLSPKAQ